MGKPVNGYTVHTIERKDAIPWIKLKHYAKKTPSISHSFGLFYNDTICGVVTYGQPPNPQPRKCCGEMYKDIVIELNRLVVESKRKNSTSFLVGKSLKLLPKPLIIVSYADPNQGHVGYIYQATNWLYTGKGGGAIELYLNGNRVNERTIDHKGIHTKKDKKKYILDMGGYWDDAKPKNRYHYFIGSKKQKKEMLKALRYPILPYPKGESKRYDTSAEFPKQVQMF